MHPHAVAWTTFKVSYEYELWLTFFDRVAHSTEQKVYARSFKIASRSICYAYVGSTSFLLIGCLSFTTKNCQVPGLSFIVKAFLWFSVCTHVSFSITRFGKWTTDCSKTKNIMLLYYNNNFNFLIRKMIEDYRLNIS